MRLSMRRVVLPALLFLAACSDDPLPTGAITAHVTHYDYELDIDERSAHAELTLVIDQGGDCLTLPLRAQLQNTPTIDDEPVNAAVAGETVTFCGAGYRTGTTITLGADVVIPLATLGTSQVGYSITKDAQQNSFYYLVSWIGGCDRFAPCDNRPDQFATYRFIVRHPAGYTARCPGTITENSDTETVCTFDYDGGPTYSTFGVAAYPAWTQTSKGSWGGIDVTVYDRAQTLIEGAIVSTYHAGFFDFMQSNFGPYPYGSELRILTAPTYWSGFEHPGNIVLDDGLARRTKPSYWNETAHVLDHEITHMWAGDQTTIASTYDFVWKESMAEYLSFVWEDMQGDARGISTAGAWKGFGVNAEYFPVPLDMPELFDYYGDVYGPGPMVLFRQLEAMTSREQVLAGIRSVLGSPRALSVDELLAALEASTGLDLDGYAAGWIRGSGAPMWPRYNITFTPGATSTLQLTQVNKAAAPRGCKFHVALHGANATDNQLVEVNTFTGGEDQTLTVLTPTFTVTSIVLDPLSECLVYAMTTSPRTLPPRRNPWLSAPHRTALDPDFSQP
jgi:aminopeptidase N